MLSWSYGGNHLVFQTYRPETRPIKAGSLYGYTLSSDMVTNFGAASTYAFRIYSVGWLSEDQLVTVDLVWENSPRYLRLVDFSKQKSNKLSNYLISSAAVDPGSETILFEIGYRWWQGPGVVFPEHDLQIINASTLERSSIPIRNYRGIEWFDSIQLFGAKNREKVIVFDERGTIQFGFEGARNINPSPYGKLILVYYTDRTDLYSIEGTFLKSFTDFDRSRTFWLPDSQAFFALTGHSPGSLVRYSAVNQWQGEVIEEVLGFNNYISLISE